MIKNEYRIIKGNKVHNTAIINWDNIQIGKNNIFFPYSIIGEVSQHPYKKSQGRLIIGNGNIFREFTTIHLPTSKYTNTTIGNNCYFMTKSHLGHDSYVENNVILSNDVNIAGHTYLMKFCQIGLNSVIHQEQVVGSYTMIGMSTIIGKKTNLRPGYIYTGFPPRGILKNKISLTRNNVTEEELKNEQIRYEKIKSEWIRK